MSFWLVMIIVGVLTYLTRLSFIWLLRDVNLSPKIKRALEMVPVAVFSVIIAQALFVQNGQLTLTLLNPRLIAGAVAVLVAWRTKNTLWTIGIGMVCLWLLLAILPG